jgi:hypothetical protein
MKERKGPTMLESLALFLEIILQLLALLAQVAVLLLPVLPLILWCVWWLLCVNWKKAWPILAAGGWVPIILLVLMSSLVWSRLYPTCDCLGFPLPVFLWQLVSVTILVLLALFCGWVQGRLGWTPAEVHFDPPPPEHGHHGHGGHH